MLCFYLVIMYYLWGISSLGGRKKKEPPYPSSFFEGRRRDRRLAPCPPWPPPAPNGKGGYTPPPFGLKDEGQRRMEARDRGSLRPGSVG